MATTHQRTRRRGALGGALEENEVSRAIESLPHPAWVADSGGALELVNTAFADYVGESAERVLVHSWDRYLHPEDRAAVMRAWYASIASGGLLRIDARLLRADLSYRRMRLRAIATRDDQGNVTHWTCMATDIDDLVDRR